MQASYFQDAVESSTKVIGRHNVSVVFEGDRAETDGNTVFLPALPHSSEITIDQAEIIRGFRDHETMHVRCTDTGKATMQKLHDLATNNQTLHKLTQYCEDIRIEHAGVSEYAGMKTSLTAIQTHAAKMLLEQLEKMGKPEEVVTQIPRNIQLRVLLQSMGRSNIGIHSGGLFEKLNDAIKAADPELYKFAAEWASKMSSLQTGFNGKELVGSSAKKGTAKSFDLAEQIFTAFGEMQPPPQPPQPGGDGQSDDKPDDCSGEGEGSGNGEDGQEGASGSGNGEDEGQPGKGDVQPSDGSGDGGGQQGGGDPSDAEDGDGDAEATSSGGGDGDQEGDTGGDAGQGTDMQQAGSGGTGSGNNIGVLPEDAVNVDDLFQDALKDVVAEVNGKDDQLKPQGKKRKRFQVYSRRLSLTLPAMEAVMGCNGYKHNDAEAVRRSKASATKQISRMDKDLTGKKAMIRRLLEVELQARSDRRWENGFKSGRLQSVRLVQAIQGRETVYQRRENGKDMDTLLYVSIDGSGSMSGSNMYESVKLAYALSEALERTGCDIIVTAWGNAAIPSTRNPKSTYLEKHVQQMQNEFNQAYHDAYRTTGEFKYTCLGLLTRSMIKTKRQRTTDANTRINFGVSCDDLNSSTPTYHAIFEDLHDMGRESHAKKIYLHITDGQPDGAASRVPVAELMSEAHEYAAALKIHMIGVGINGMKVTHMFKDSISVTGSDAYEPVIKRLAKLVAEEAGHAPSFKRAA